MWSEETDKTKMEMSPSKYVLILMDLGTTFTFLGVKMTDQHERFWNCSQ